MKESAELGLPQDMLAAAAQMIHQMYGIDPEDEEALLNAAAVGLVLEAWRNSPLEDIHASPTGPTDGEMFAQSVYLYCKARQALKSARKGNFRPLSALVGAMTNPDRPWAGRSSFTLRRSGADLAEFQEHVENRIWYTTSLIEKQGWREALMQRAVSASAASHHFGMPRWSDHVDAAMNSMKDIDPETTPTALIDHEEVRRALLEEPDRLGAEALEWLIDRGVLR
ncbi:hypothetical protein [Streptosporangium canum]|uniref:hypothetical protein n=1 Tax=Streptosporangium canum TaxID=324952 RepID=UPI0037903024